MHAVHEREQRARLAAAQDAEAGALKKLERDIHDGPQQRLVRLQLDIARAERAADDAQKSREILSGARVQAQEALDELRATSRGIAPQGLTARGLARAVEEIAGRCPLPMRVDIELPRLPAQTETALYYVVSEAVTNVIKHAQASLVRVTGVLLAEGEVVVTVWDDGRGGAQFAKGSGLRGLEQRMTAVGGTLEVSSPAGGPTSVEGHVPCVLS